jgi:ATP-dependent Clp protease adaptor protein ClpS
LATKVPPPAAPRTKPADDDGDGTVVLERLPQKVKPPQMYQEFFNKDRETATQIMLKIHLDGKGVCGVFSKDVAATKVDQVTEAAKKSGHPLQCVSEPLN